MKLIFFYKISKQKKMFLTSIMLIGLFILSIGTPNHALAKIDKTDLLVADDYSFDYGSYFGGAADENVHSILVDNQNNSYVIGYTYSTDFPLINEHDNTLNGTTDGFISKFDSSNSLVMSTYFGGNASDLIFDSVIDSNQNLYVTGVTTSYDLGTLNAYNNTYSNQSYDGFVAKFNPSGDLQFSTYLGGNGDDTITSIALDSNNNIFVGGTTTSTDFPVLNGYNSTFGGGSYYGDGFLTKFSNDGTLLFSTYFGGTNEDSIDDLATDSSGNVLVVGSTSSSNLPMKNSYNSTFSGNYDVFLAKFNSTGMLDYSTYLGGKSKDSYARIAVDSNGNCFIAGTTQSGDFPVKNSMQTYNGSSDTFVAKFDGTGSLLFSTLIGGNNTDSVYKLALDSDGNCYITGSTLSVNFPLKNPFSDQYKGGNPHGDAFLVKLSLDGTLIYSTYFGGTAGDTSESIAINAQGSIYLVGYTRSTDFPVKNAYNSTYSGGNFYGDAFIMIFGPTHQIQITPTSATTTTTTSSASTTSSISSSTTSSTTGKSSTDKPTPGFSLDVLLVVFLIIYPLTYYKRRR